jgi:hypothetical protein
VVVCWDAGGICVGILAYFQVTPVMRPNPSGTVITCYNGNSGKALPSLNLPPSK